MRKLTFLTILLTLVLAPFIQSEGQVVQAQGPFPDMPAYGGSEITRLYQDNILQGNPDGTLRPNDQVTRAEAVTLLGRALKLDGTQRATKFSDVSANHYASGYIASGTERGLIAGTTPTTFSPNSPVTRAQMAVFLSRAFDLKSTRHDVVYRDVNANTFGATQINAITTARISAGYPDGTFGPNNGTTRLEFALFLARALYPEYKLPEYQPNQDLLDSVATRAVVYNAPDGLNVRSTPDTSRPPIGRLSNGDVVQYYATTGNWAVFTYQGQTAYVSLSYLRAPSGGGGSGSLQGKVIVVDPGHGGKDPGAVANGVREKDVVLNVGLKLKRRLEAAGATVVMTRSSDVFLELSDRVAIANNRNADAFISVHANAAGSSAANGTETFWHRNYASASSKKLADSIQSELIKKLKTNNRGVKEGNFHVIRNTRMASVLVEVGFLTNAEEARKLASDSFQEDAAEAIYQGVLNFFK